MAGSSEAASSISKLTRLLPAALRCSLVVKCLGHGQRCASRGRQRGCSSRLQPLIQGRMRLALRVLSLQQGPYTEQQLQAADLCSAGAMDLDTGSVAAAVACRPRVACGLLCAS